MAHTHVYSVGAALVLLILKGQCMRQTSDLTLAEQEFEAVAAGGMAFASVAQAPAAGASLEGQTKAAVDSARLAAEPLRVNYKIDITTGLSNGASTQSPVYMTMYGTQGDSGEFSLVAANSPYSPMKRGAAANITKALKDVGIITKIKLRNPSEDDWQCASIVIHKAGGKYEFQVNKWVSSPKQTTRWAFSEVEYTLMITTGAVAKSGTQGKQFITIFGAQGSTGEILLGDSFDRETTVTATLKAVDVGKLSYIVLHNPSQDEWYCETIRITTSHGDFQFSAMKWVATPIHPKASVPVDKSYQIYAETPADADDATTGQIDIQIFGVAGASRVRPLSTAGFQAGRRMAYEVSAKDVGRVTKIKLSTNSKDGWHCKSIDILYGTKRRAHFDVDSWVQYPMAASLSVVADIPYTVVIKTAADANADSMGEFAANIYGSLGVTRTLPLKNKAGFSKGSESRFTLSAKDVGELTKLRLSTRSSDEWKVKDVTITKEEHTYPFSVDKWIEFPLAATVDTNVDIKYTFSIVTGKQNSADTTAMIYITLYGTRGQSRYLPLKTGFAVGSAETVSFKTQDVGYLTRIKLTSTATDDWFCDRMMIKYGSDTANFEVGKWLVFPNSPNLFVDRKGVAQHQQ